MSLPRIYTVGASPLFLLVSHEIAKLAKQPTIPNIILMLNDSSKLNRFLKNDSKISIVGSNDPPSQFMATCNPPTLVSGKNAVIDNLIVMEQNKKSLLNTMKKYNASLDKTSNILLIDPPIGTIEYLQSKIWQDYENAPNLFIGITNFKPILGRSTLRLNKVKHHNKINNNLSLSHEFSMNIPSYLTNGSISLSLSSIPKQFASYEEYTAQEQLPKLRQQIPLIDLMFQLKRFDTSAFTFGEIYLLRMENLIIESCIEAMAVLYNCQYRKELLELMRAPQIFKSLIKEQLRILSTSHLNLTSLPNYHNVLNEQRLFDLIINELSDSPSKKKSTLTKDIKQLNLQRLTEMNQYFVQLAHSNNIGCRWNEIITWLIKGKAKLTKNRALDYRYL